MPMPPQFLKKAAGKKSFGMKDKPEYPGDKKDDMAGMKKAISRKLAKRGSKSTY